jgi:hypothetical protein
MVYNYAFNINILIYKQYFFIRNEHYSLGFSIIYNIMIKNIKRLYIININKLNNKNNNHYIDNLFKFINIYKKSKKSKSLFLIHKVHLMIFFFK